MSQGDEQDTFQRVPSEGTRRLNAAINVTEDLWSPLAQRGGEHGVFKSDWTLLNDSIRACMGCTAGVELKISGTGTLRVLINTQGVELERCGCYRCTYLDKRSLPVPLLFCV